MVNKLLRRGWITSGLLVCLVLAWYFLQICLSEFALYQANQLLLQKNNNSESVDERQLDQAISQIKSAPISASNAAKRSRLLTQLYRWQAELTVWSSKRRLLYRDALFQNYNAINEHPNHLQSWLLNLELQALMAVDNKQQLWSLQRTLELGRWNLSALQYSSFYCVLYWQQLDQYLSNQCTKAMRTVLNDGHYGRLLETAVATIDGHQTILDEVVQ